MKNGRDLRVASGALIRRLDVFLVKMPMSNVEWVSERRGTNRPRRNGSIYSQIERVEEKKYISTI